MITKERLVFDTANLTEGDVVASFLKGADGTLLTHTTVGGKEALDVNITNAITVDIDAASDSVASWTNDGAGNPIGSTGGALHISDAGGSLTVDATNLDIRDLSHTQDSVKIGDGTDFLAVNNDGSINAVVSATNLDIRDLAFATDKVDVSGSSVSITGDVNVTQGTSPWVVSDAALANSALTSTAASVTSSSAALLGAQASGRKYLLAQNLGNRSIYIGASGVSSSTGIRLSPGSSIEMRLGPAVSLHAVTDSGTQDTRLLEIA